MHHPVSDVDPKVSIENLKWVDKLIYQPVVPQQTFPVAYHDNLKYHLYAGTVAAVIGEYGVAIDLLEAVSTACF